jgi:hypothetical protein
MNRDVLIGTLTGISAVLATALLAPRPQPPLPVRELAGTPAQVIDEELGRPMLPSTRPDATKVRLARSLERVEVRGMRLDKFLSYLADAAGVNVFVEWRALESAGIDAGVPVTLDLRNVPASAALERALAEVGGGNVRLAYEIDEGVVRVSTADELAKHTWVRVYDVRDLLESEVLHRRSLAVTGQATSGEPDAVDNLCRLLQEFIDPTSWRDAGGSAGAVRPFGGRLIVTQTLENHEQVAELLAALRHAGRAAR